MGMIMLLMVLMEYWHIRSIQPLLEAVLSDKFILMIVKLGLRSF